MNYVLLQHIKLNEGMQKFSKIRTFNVHRKAIAKIKDITCLKILHFTAYKIKHWLSASYSIQVLIRTV